MADIVLKDIGTINIKENTPIIFSVPQNYLGTKAKLTIVKVLKSDLTETLIYTSEYLDITEYIDNSYDFTINLPTDSIPSLDTLELTNYTYYAQILICNKIDNTVIVSSNKSYFQIIEGTTLSISNLSTSPTNITTSTFDITMTFACIKPQYTDSTSIKKYQVYLLDLSDNIIFSSGDLYDWYNPNKVYRLTNLKNDTSYKVKYSVETVGGYKAESITYQINVSYSTAIEDEDFILSIDTFNRVRGNYTVSVGTTYNSYMIYRSVKNSGRWTNLGASFYVKNHILNSNNIISFVDIFNADEVDYEYKILLYNNDSLVKTVSKSISSYIDGVAITDGTDYYSTILDYQIIPISKEIESSVVKVQDKKFPYIITNGVSNFFMCEVKTTFVEATDKETICDAISEYFTSEKKRNNLNFNFNFLNFLTNNRPKYFKTGNGIGWIVSTNSAKPQISYENNAYQVTFTCVQIAEDTDILQYGFS